MIACKRRLAHSPPSFIPTRSRMTTPASLPRSSLRARSSTLPRVPPQGGEATLFDQSFGPGVWHHRLGLPSLPASLGGWPLQMVVLVVTSGLEPVQWWFCVTSLGGSECCWWSRGLRRRTPPRGRFRLLSRGTQALSVSYTAAGRRPRAALQWCANDVEISRPPRWDELVLEV